MKWLRSTLVLSFALALVNGCGGGTPHRLTRTDAMPTTEQLPAWLPGMWTREWIERAGARTSAFDVHYLQTPSAFADVRIPRERAALVHASSFADLSDDDLRLLARQRGFAGFTTVAGALATWHHEIDFQPPDSDADIGRLERIDASHMLEHAPDSSYVESWRAVDSSAGHFLVLREAREGRVRRMLLVGGDHFLYVRNRGHDLPMAESLDSLISRQKATRAQIIGYVDCEFSAGRVQGGRVPWEIQQSTLPWREGRHLEFVDSIAISEGSIAPRPPAASSDLWTVPVNTFEERDLEAMFGAQH